MKHSSSKLPYEWLEEIINLAAEWVVVVDCDGVILYINSAYCDFLETSVKEAIGRHVTEVIENTRMHIVTKTRQPEIASIHSIKGSEMIANRHPLFVNDQLVGAVGTVMFRNSEDWLAYSKKVQPLLEELKYYKKRFENELKSKYSFDDLIGENEQFVNAKKLAQRVSGSQSAVLLLGESGTGKELFAHGIHGASNRGVFPFVRVNSASIPEHLLESELFGYEEGAFTGAKKGGKKGKFELAHRGTIFLDEIGDMPLAMQSKLLRVLQEKEIERVGGQTPTPIDVRVIAATHRNLEEMVKRGEFRQDLYYRLNVMKIEIPSLKQRTEDLEAIANVLLKKLEKKFNRQHITISPEVINRLLLHSWPGNIRELENVLERSVNVLDENVIRRAHLPLYLREDIQPNEADEEAQDAFKRDPAGILPLKQTLAAAEVKALKQALAAADGNKQEAAKILGISKTSFYDKYKFYGL
ncbi:transcriptional regulator with PAS, ATPase and Fis domain [Bacillus ectoiniformans]|uniref:sigma-54 interaction domain-containing protein n=1 Tax=Bacillus ectoiniformans TaxID=1494429 RepID=UPI001956DCF0|nr:sigma 54-interacting transcriptional regulator [Bacillus ectoiniformans]MBM7648271.1 transcriptional regulator with PAS, ATPase and Fis domain [Bacillus ectoiniformans]